MGENSKIEWTTHTFNPWWGCTKVSEACKHCYAEAWAKRLGQRVWGPKSKRRFFTDQHWKQPLTWNRKAEGAKERPRVFCASMADVFENQTELESHRRRLWDLIEATPNLDWLLLTKRPMNVKQLSGWTLDWPPFSF
jgi:protein gp37